MSATSAGPAIAAPSGHRAATTSASLPDTAFAASAYATYVAGAVAGGGVTSGTTVPSSFSCSTVAGQTRTNKIASINNGALTTGAVTTSAQSIATANSRTARSTAEVAGLSLLSGLIKASGVSTTSTSTISSTGASSGTSSSTLAGLSVGGTKIAANVAPNTKLSLSLNGAVIGRVVINEQQKSTVSGYTATTTRALDINITAKNSLGLDVGARIIVGHSTASLAAAPAGFAGGSGFATRASTLNGAVKSGPTSSVGVPCTGGSRTANAAGSSLPGLISVGAATTTSTSTTNPALSSHVVSTIASVGILANFIKTTGIVADTTSTRASKSAPVHSADRSKFGSLTVAGLAKIDANVPVNTTVNLAGLGKVTFHKRASTTSGTRVTMIYVVLGKALGGLPTGTILEIGVSDTSVR